MVEIIPKQDGCNDKCLERSFSREEGAITKVSLCYLVRVSTTVYGYWIRE